MRTLKKVNLELVFTEFIPEFDKMEFGKFYYSRKYKVSNHLCPCGCGTQTPLPIKEGEWWISIDKNQFTITPSILHKYIYGCRSHYVINNNIASILDQ